MPLYETQLQIDKRCQQPGQAGPRSEGRHKPIPGGLAAAVQAADTLGSRTGVPFCRW